MASDTIPNGGPVENVPAELRARPQWVGWRRVVRDGKPTKVPVDPKTGGPGNATAPATWGTFEVALAGARSGGWDGVGFVFTAADPYLGIDWDDVIDPATGEIDPDAAAEVESFASYAELTPSGAGVHVIIRAAAGRPGRKAGDRECYDRGRFFTVTGRACSPHGVEDRQTAFDGWHRRHFPDPAAAPPARTPAAPLDLSDAELVAKIRQSKQAEKFNRLWAGDGSGYASASEADLALAAVLAGWCRGDAARVDRLFRASGLMRPKWDARRGAGTYGSRTVEKAVAGSQWQYDPAVEVPGVTYHPPEANAYPESAPVGVTQVDRQFKWWSELRDHDEATQWLWKGYFPRGGIVLLSALWKAGKTTLLAELVKAFGNGSATFLGREIAPARVLYCTEEMERHWSRRRPPANTDHVGFYIQPFAAKPKLVDWYKFIDTLAADVERHGFDLVVFDTLSDLWPVMKENDAGEVQAALSPLRKLAKTGAAVLIVHHLRKSGGEEHTGSRGSGVLGSFPDVLIDLKRHKPRKPDEDDDEDDGAAEDNRRVLVAKGRYDETPAKLRIQWTRGQGFSLLSGRGAGAGPAAGGLTVTVQGDDYQKVWAVVAAGPAEGMTQPEITAAMQRAFGHAVRKEEFRPLLTRLCSDRRLVVEGEGGRYDPRRYRLHPATDADA